MLTRTPTVYGTVALPLRQIGLVPHTRVERVLSIHKIPVQALTPMGLLVHGV